MTEQAIASRVARASPRRRWSDAHPLALGAFMAGLTALMLHALPESLGGLRVVLITLSVLTAGAILALLLIERLGWAPDGRRHRGRRHTDWRS